ncbi:MAG: hypothetical protein PHF29_05200 [Candidatus Riflebacteria bacterium]|nr:hypothetical protein [Candidatus Riflebacteria bacterium]
MISCKKLISLQDLDLKIDSVRAQIEEKKQKFARMQSDIQEEAKLNEKKSALLKKIQVRKRQFESDLNVHTDKLKTIKLKMKNAGVLPSVYVALEKEADTLKKQVDELETKIIEDMEKLELLKADLDKNEKIVNGRNEHLLLVKQRTQEEIKKLNGEIEILKTQRSQETLSIDTFILEKYEELRHTKNGEIIFGVDILACPKCGMGFSAGFQNLLKSHDDGEFCPNCGVFLYWTGNRE